MSTQPTLPILVVEDDQPTQSLLRAVLRRYGFGSEIAANGREAIALLQAAPYAAVILDMMMPEVSGHEVVAHLAGSAHRIPVIICSAAGPAALAGLDPSVVKGIIRKPFDVDELVTMINTVTRPAD